MKRFALLFIAALIFIAQTGCGNTDVSSPEETIIPGSVTDVTSSTATSATISVQSSTVGITSDAPAETAGAASETVTTAVTTAEQTQTTGHTHSFSEWKVVSQASCTEDGRQERVCAECGEKETRKTDALGHTWGSWKTTKEATTEKEGEQVKACLVCGSTKTQPIPKLEAPKTSDSAKLLEILKNNNYTLDDLSGTSQCIAVVSSGSSCTVYLFEKTDGIWTKVSSTNGIVGKNGVSASSREGDYRTPKGIFGLGFAFGTEAISDLHIPYRKVNSDCYWVDDPESEYYNQWVETDDIQWNSAEHLIDYPNSYHYAVVINYNMDPIVAGAGSAIFLHCKTGTYTAGCVAVPQADMLEILYWLRSDASPVILIS